MELKFKEHKIAEVIQKRYCPNIYFLLNNDEVVYVGQSVTVNDRIKGHVADKEFDAVYKIDITHEELLNWEEIKYIYKYQPLYNKTFKDGEKLNHTIARKYLKAMTMKRISPTEYKQIFFAVFGKGNYFTDITFEMIEKMALFIVEVEKMGNVFQDVAIKCIKNGSVWTSRFTDVCEILDFFKYAG